jgi:acyl-CoA reductase-like NAD-dependent aldehyde dehydrogenase
MTFKSRFGPYFVAPVIAGGNTCVILASEQKALCAVTFAEVLATSDVPAGVVNILTGQRKELLSHMSNHMDVNAVYLSSSDKAELKLVEELSNGSFKWRFFTTEPKFLQD